MQQFVHCIQRERSLHVLMGILWGVCVCSQQQFWTPLCKHGNTPCSRAAVFHFCFNINLVVGKVPGSVYM